MTDTEECNNKWDILCYEYMFVDFKIILIFQFQSHLPNFDSFKLTYIHIIELEQKLKALQMHAEPYTSNNKIFTLLIQKVWNFVDYVYYPSNRMKIIVYYQLCCTVHLWWSPAQFFIGCPSNVSQEKSRPLQGFEPTTKERQHTSVCS